MNKRTTEQETEMSRWQNIQKGSSSIGQECVNYFYPKYQHGKPYSYFKFEKRKGFSSSICDSDSGNIVYAALSLHNPSTSNCQNNLPKNHRSEHIIPQVRNTQTVKQNKTKQLFLDICTEINIDKLILWPDLLQNNLGACEGREGVENSMDSD